MQRICVIEDNVTFREMIAEELSSSFVVSQAGTVAEVMNLARTEAFALFLVDVRLPDGSGFELVWKLRNYFHLTTPVIFLTGVSDDLDKALGFSMGGDEYITKPFDLAELKKRVEARIRGSLESSHVAEFSVAGLQFDVNSRRAFSCDGETRVDLGLTSLEFSILYLLARHPEQYFESKRILELVRGEAGKNREGALYAHISMLRKKLGDKRKHVESRPGDGYRFVPVVQDRSMSSTL